MFCVSWGSFVAATKLSVTEFADEFADYGFIVVTPDYRVGYNNNNGVATCFEGDDSSGLQGAIYRAEQDANACIRFVANHAGNYNIDSSNIFLAGASAGGTLALNVAYVNDSLAAIYYPNLVATWGTLQNSGNNEPFTYKLKALCPMWGALPYWENIINSATAIPTILYMGGLDNNVPNGVGYYLNCPYNFRVRAGSGIYDIMNNLQVPCVFHYQPYAGHAAYDNDFCSENTACFFNAIMKPYTLQRLLPAVRSKLPLT